MTKKSIHAVILAVAVATGGASFTSIATAAAPTLSAAVATPLDAANKAIKANRLDEALVKLREVAAVSGKTPAETHIMNQLLSFVLLKQNKFAEALPVLEQMLASGTTTAAEKTTINKQLLGIYSAQKNYPKMLEIGQGLISAGAADNAHEFVAPVAIGVHRVGLEHRGNELRVPHGPGPGADHGFCSNVAPVNDAQRCH